jgi:hypothetical protein
MCEKKRDVLNAEGGSWTFFNVTASDQRQLEMAIGDN